MTKEENTLLNDLLIKFFAESKFDAPNFLVRNQTASLLKGNLMKLGYWRNRPRNKKPIMSEKMWTKQFSEKLNRPDKDCPF